jgi:hypothetical protein
MYAMLLKRKCRERDLNPCSLDEDLFHSLSK